MTRTRYYFLYQSKSNGIFLKDSLFRGTCGTVSWQVRRSFAFIIYHSHSHTELTSNAIPFLLFLKFRFPAGWIIFETGGDVECALQPQHPRLLLLRLADSREAQGDKNWCLEDLMAKVMLLLKSSSFDSTNHSIFVQGKDRDGWFSEMYHSNGWDIDFPISKTCKSFSVKCFLLCNS